MPTIHLNDDQACAMLEHGQHGTRPAGLGQTGQTALDGAVAKLKNAVDDCAFRADIRLLADVLRDAEHRPFVDAVHRRLRDILVLSRLWTAAEQIPETPDEVLEVDRLDDPLWPSEVLTLLDQHGIDLDLPGDNRDANSGEAGQ